MAWKCAGCGAEADVVEKEEHVRRINAKETANKELKTQLADAEKRAAAAGTATTELADLKAKYAAITERTERDAAFAAAGIAADEKIRGRFGVMYDADMAGKEEAERVPFAEWLVADDQKADPFLSPHYGKSGTPPAPDTRTSPTPKVKPAAKIDAGAGDAPTKDGIETPEQAQAFFASDEYRNLEPAEQKRVMGELASKVGVPVVRRPGTMPSPRRPAPKTGTESQGT